MIYLVEISLKRPEGTGDKGITYTDNLQISANSEDAAGEKAKEVIMIKHGYGDVMVHSIKEKD